MATTETAAPTTPPPRRPSSQATLAAAAQGTLASGRVAVTPTLIATGAATRAVAEATETVVEALAAFARTRTQTVIPLLQRQLTETFVDREPVEIAKLLAKEAARERSFQRRQTSRIRRDLPKVLAEADIAARKQKLQKLLKRERYYIGLRERAMTARAHSVVDSLRIQEASPQGAYWRLGHAIHHTPGCIAMSGKFWPWSVLREVGIPPIHPGCACELLTMEAAGRNGLMTNGDVPSAKDALARARRFMALEEALYEAELDDDVIEQLVAERLVEVEERYPKGTEHGGEWMPSVGRDFSGARGLVHRLIPGFHHGDDRKVWIGGHHVTVPHGRDWNRRVGGALWSSPSGSTHVYRDGEMVAPEGEHPTHPQMQVPTGSAPARVGVQSPHAPVEVTQAEHELDAQLSAQVKVSTAARKSPVMVGQSGTPIHRALIANGYELTKQDATKKRLRATYDHPLGHRVKLEFGRKSGRVEDVRWTPGALGAKGQKPISKWSGWTPSKFGPLVGADGKPLPPPKPLKPVPPTILPALRDTPAPPSAIPNADHVALTVRAHSDDAKDEAGNHYLFHTGEPDHVASELLANAIYRKLGVPVEPAALRHVNEPDFASIPDEPLGEGPINSKGKRTSTGIIIRDPSGNVTVFEPLNHYGGYEHSFPKGGVEPGLTPQQNAHKELYEETGLHAKITGVVGDYDGDSSVSRYYTGILTGGAPTAGNETEAVKTVPPGEAATLLNRQRDKDVLADLLKKYPEPPKAFEGDDPFPPIVQQPGVLVQPSESKSGYISTPSEAIGQHYMADALLGNWDALGVGGSNIRYSKVDGTPIRTSTAGSLGYREDGREKPFGPVPSEVWTLRDPRGAHFGRSVTSQASRRAEAADIVSKLKPEDVDDLIGRAPFRTDEAREHARMALKGRLAWFDRYAKGEESEPEMAEGKAAAADLTASQKGLELFPEQHAALALFPSFEHEFEGHFGAGKTQAALKGDAAPVAKQLDSLLRFASTDNDVVSYIGVDPKLMGSNPIGKTLSARSYLTATLSEGEARKDPGVIQLIIPRASHAIYTRGIEGIEPGDVDPAMPDIITERGSRIRVVSTSQREGKTYYEAVLLP